jgi:CHAD domain-containing protein
LAWIEDLRQAQDLLGELHDLQILIRTLADGGSHRKQKDLPVLRAELEGQRLQHWLRWHELSQRLLADSNRYSIQRQLLELGRNADPAVA